MRHRAPRPRSSNHVKAIRRLSREHARIANLRRCFLHEVSSQLVKTHDRLCLEDLAVVNLLGNRRLARAISDAAWTELARQLHYKADWFGAELVVCDRWAPSTRTCSQCGRVAPPMKLGERVYCCQGCGLVVDRDCNAAANLAAWAEVASMAAAQAPDRRAGGRMTNASGGEGAGHRDGDGGTGPVKEEPGRTPLRRPARTPEKGAAGRPRDEEFDRLQWNDSPQAQEPAALGLSIVKPDFSRVSR